jgi:alkylation response protein AidB-like acyl-CoA dehydrogenase
MDFNLSDEQEMLKKAARDFSDAEIEKIAARIDAEGRLPDELIKKMAAQGLFGMAVPKKYGGSGLGELSCIVACEQMAYSGCGAWWLLAFNNSIPETIANFGSDYIKDNFIKPLCDGSAYSSIQFTEADTGSDPKALVTRCRREKDHYVIDGSKRFSTFGARDGNCVIFARDEDQSCTAFVVPKNRPGYSVSKKWELMGSGGIETVDVFYDNYRVPEKNLLGTRGKGFDVLLSWIAIEKIQQCAACVGIARAALDEARKFAKSRMVSGKPMSSMQGIRWMLSDIQSKIEASRYYTYRAAKLKDENKPEWVNEAAAAKSFVVPAAMEAVELSRRIHGAYGYTKEFKIERLYRAIAGASAIAVSLEINKSIFGASLAK